MRAFRLFWNARSVAERLTTGRGRKYFFVNKDAVTMELQTYLSIFNKRKKMIAIVFSALFILVVAVTLVIPPKYSSTARLRVLTPIGGGTNYLSFDIWYATRLMNTYASLASSSAVKDVIKEKFNRTTDPDISATVIADSEIIRITVLDSDPIMSAAIANSIAGILLENKSDSALEVQSASDSVIAAQLEAVNKKLTEARASYREIFIPYTQNNSKIELLTTEIQNERSMFVTIKDRIESGRQSNVSADILAEQETQLQELQNKIDQKVAEIEAMNARAAEDSNRIDIAQRDISLLENQYSNIVLQMDQLKSLQALQFGSESLMLVDEAIPSRSPSVPNYLLIFTLGFFISLFLAMLIAVALENLDDTFVSPDQVSSLNRSHFWGDIFHKENQDDTLPARSTNDEAVSYGMKEFQMENFPDVQSIQAMVVSGVENGASKTKTWVKLAREFADRGRRTILVDCDLASPSIHKQLDHAVNDIGLYELLTSAVSLDEALKETKIQNLSILTAGQTGNGKGLRMDPQRMGQIIDELKLRYSMIILGIPSIPALQGNDDFIYRTDGVVMAVEYGNARKKHISESIAYLKEIGVPFLGYVISHEQKSPIARQISGKLPDPKMAAGLDQV